MIPLNKFAKVPFLTAFLPSCANGGRFTETKREPQPADPFRLYGLQGAGFDFRHSREGGNPDG